MTNQSFIRCSALALIVGGGISIVRTLLHPDETVAGALLNSLWVAVHIAAAISFMLLAFGLIGLYLSQARAIGNFGFIAFVIAFFGSVVLVGLTIDEAFFIRNIAVHDPAVQTLSDFFGSVSPELRGYSAIFSLGGLLYLLGYSLMGLATVRGRVLPRWAGWLLTIGGVMSFGTAFGFILVRVIGGVLYGIAFIWLGIALWTHPDRQPNDSDASPA